MLKKRRPISIFLGKCLSLILSSGFLIAAELNWIIPCYILGSFIGIFTFWGILGMIDHSPVRIAYIMRVRGHNWTIYLSMLITIRALLILEWMYLTYAYTLVISLGFALRFIGFLRIRKMSREDFTEFVADVVIAIDHKGKIKEA